MSPAHILRKAFVFSLVILLTAAMFAGCGEKNGSDKNSDEKTEKNSEENIDSSRENTKDYTKEESGENLIKGKAAYEIGKYDDAIMSFSIAVQQGNAEAMYRLGKCFLDGTGVPRDTEKAVSHFRNAEKAGYFIDPDTQYEVGGCFISGDGVRRDATEAVKWYRKAAEQGHAEAQVALGKCYCLGNGVKQDYEEAVRWYRKAAEQGQSEAKEALVCFDPVDLSGDETEVTVIIPGGVSWKMVKVEAGSFTMSARDGENESNEVSHRATLTKDFYIGQTEVTQAQWKAVMGTNPSYRKGDDLPVEYVSWNEAMEFCEMLNSMGKAPNGWKFTLPTETQWEYAARGGNKSEGFKYSGSDSIGEVAWYEDNSGFKTHPVGQKKANELGICDMSGNVYEWCLDDWNEDSSKLTAEFSHGNDRSGSNRAYRGGGLSHSAGSCRSAYRHCSIPGFRFSGLGFRVALVPESY